MNLTIKNLIIATAIIALLAEISPIQAALAESAEAAKPLKTGASAPDVSLQTADGKMFSLLEETKERPAVVIFYRGGWCPFCNRQLASLQGAHEELKSLGYQILAISPDDPKGLTATTDKNNLAYTLLSDSEMQASEAFGLAFKTNGRRGSWLPVPAVYILKDGKLPFAYSNPDYKTRLDTADLLKAAKEIAGK